VVDSLEAAIDQVEKKWHRPTSSHFTLPH
jgi:hypothetical protein